MKFRDGTITGGLLTLAGYTVMLIYTVYVINQSILSKDYTFVVKEIKLSEDSPLMKQAVALSDYNNSLNFAVGIAHDEPGFDILDNEYVEFVAYEFIKQETNEQSVLKKPRILELEKCKSAELDRYMPPATRSWYPNPLCIKNRHAVMLMGNYYMSDYIKIAIAVHPCKATATKQCKSKAEIDDFVENHPFFFVSQQTNVIPEMFEDSADVNKSPNTGDKATYFPVRTSLKSNDF